MKNQPHKNMWVFLNKKKRPTHDYVLKKVEVYIYLWNK